MLFNWPFNSLSVLVELVKLFDKLFGGVALSLLQQVVDGSAHCPLHLLGCRLQIYVLVGFLGYICPMHRLSRVQG